MLTLLHIVDCEWDAWIIGECSQTCGGGFRTNTRVPLADEQHGGAECTGASTVYESCNIQECPGNFLLMCRMKWGSKTYYNYQANHRSKI